MDDNRVTEFLAIAESDLIDYRSCNDFVTDEARLLRGCLAGIVAIARFLDREFTPPETEGLP